MSASLTRRRATLILWSLALILAIAGTSTADETPSPLVLVETDPLAFVASGFSAHVGFAAPEWSRLVLGVSIVGGLDLPDALVEANPLNAGKGWSVRINRGAGLWAHLEGPLGSANWFTGLQLFTQEMQLETTLVTGEVDRTNLAMAALQLGIRWSPFRAQDTWLSGLYLRPWAGVGYQWIVAGTFEPGVVTPETRVGTLEYDLQPIMPFATVHLGYAFGRRGEWCSDYRARTTGNSR